MESKIKTRLAMLMRQWVSRNHPCSRKSQN